MRDLIAFYDTRLFVAKCFIEKFVEKKYEELMNEITSSMLFYSYVIKYYEELGNFEIDKVVKYS